LQKTKGGGKRGFLKKHRGVSHGRTKRPFSEKNACCGRGPGSVTEKKSEGPKKDGRKWARKRGKYKHSKWAPHQDEIARPTKALRGNKRKRGNNLGKKTKKDGNFQVGLE